MAADEEHVIQREIVRALRADGLLVFAIPNGGNRNVVTATRLKAEGVTAGVPDLFVADFGGFFLEVKTDAGSLSRAQREMSAGLALRGYLVHTVRSPDDARRAAHYHKGKWK